VSKYPIDMFPVVKRGLSMKHDGCNVLIPFGELLFQQTKPGNHDPDEIAALKKERGYFSMMNASCRSLPLILIAQIIALRSPVAGDFTATIDDYVPVYNEAASMALPFWIWPSPGNLQLRWLLLEREDLGTPAERVANYRAIYGQKAPLPAYLEPKKA
jgi:hypothetical protein